MAICTNCLPWQAALLGSLHHPPTIVTGIQKAQLWASLVRASRARALAAFISLTKLECGVRV